MKYKVKLHLNELNGICCRIWGDINKTSKYGDYYIHREYYPAVELSTGRHQYWLHDKFISL